MISKDELLRRLEEADCERFKWGRIYRLGDILPEADEHIEIRSWFHKVEGGALRKDVLHVAEGVWLDIYEKGKVSPAIDVHGIRVLVRDEPLPMICGGDITYQIEEGEYGPTIRQRVWDYICRMRDFMEKSLENQMAIGRGRLEE